MFLAVVLLAAIAFDGSYSQTPPVNGSGTVTGVDTCDSTRQYSGSSIFCKFPVDCCTRLTCSVPALGEALAGGTPVMEISINPCTHPVTMNIIVHDQNSVLFSRSGISTSQSIPIGYGPVPGATTSIDLLFNATDSYVTVGLSTFGITLLEPTRIDISDPGCSMGITQPPACLVTVAPPTPSVATPTPISTVTCKALQQLAGGGNIGTDVNQCRVSSSCTSVDCNYLGVFPFTLTILPCNSPPGINFVAYDDTGKTSVIFNETITDTRRISLGDDLGTDSAIIIAIDHPCGKDAIVAQVIFSTAFNTSVLPPTTIPLDRSDCANFVPTNTPCQEAPTSFNDVCDAVLSSFQSSGDTCTTNYPNCTTTMCDLSSFSLPVMYGYTIQPCTAVPSVRVRATENGKVILDEVLSESRVETLNVGPTNVSVHFIVKQSPPDYRDIGVGVNLISTDPPVEIPFLPETSIPLDRCACDNITCPSGPEVKNQDANQGGTQEPKNNSGDSNVTAPAVVAAVLFILLVAVIVVAIVMFVMLRRSHHKELNIRRNPDVSYKNLSNSGDVEDSEKQ